MFLDFYFFRLFELSFELYSISFFNLLFTIIGLNLDIIHFFSSFNKLSLKSYFELYFENRHADIKNIGMNSSYKIMFLEQPEFKSLD